MSLARRGASIGAGLRRARIARGSADVLTCDERLNR
jgi:hypothetical protein